MKIKKVYEAVVQLLEANTTLTVAEVLDEVKALCAAKTGGNSGTGGNARTHRRDAEGNVTHIQDYYDKLWKDVRVADFGAKKGSPTGLNTMTKESVSNWNAMKKAEAKVADQVLQEVISGELAQDRIEDRKAELLESATVIVAPSDGYGFATLEEALADSEARGLAV